MSGANAVAGLAGLFGAVPTERLEVSCLFLIFEGGGVRSDAGSMESAESGKTVLFMSVELTNA